MTNRSQEASGLDTAALRGRIDARLAQLVPEDTVAPEKLHHAIRYSLLAPGKRIRPIQTLLAARSFGCGEDAAALDPACAIEMVHAASLIVDDLPFMDDAQERRGRATSHRAFGLQTATLASLALLNRAFSVMAEAEGLDDAVRIELVRLLSRALGDTGGAIAGQEEDLESPGEDFSISALETMVRHKTGALFVASAEAGARIANASPERLAAAREFGWSFGLCFQAHDDLADQPDGSGNGERDSAHAKATFVSVLGVEGSRRAAAQYARKALMALRGVCLETSPLAHLAESLAVGDGSRAVSSL